MQLSRHAEVRLQQRGVSPLILDWLEQYGARERAGRGAEVWFFNRKSRKALQKDMGKGVVDRLADLLDTYAVVSDETLVTVGHRYKPVRRA